MFGKTYTQFKAMRPSVRALVFLHWIYAFAGSLVGVFIQIFLYQKFTSIELNILATIVFYAGVMTGFCMFGYVTSIFKLDIKQGFLWSFVVMAAAIFFLLYTSSTLSAYFTMLLWGIGEGLYWLTVNTYTLSETRDHERDFYTSIQSAGTQILTLLGPATAALLIWVSTLLNLGTYTLLFTIAPAVYLLGFFFFASIKEYRPKPILWGDVVHFFSDRRNQVSQLYILGGGFNNIFGIAVVPLVLFFILGTSLNVGIYNAFFAFFSAFCLVVVARYRTPQNRLQLLRYVTFGMVLITALFGYIFTFWALVLYTLLEGVLGPLMSVTTSVIDLQTMESIGKEGTDFFATMIFRDFSLWVWRSLAGIIFLILLIFIPDQKTALSIGMYMLAASLLLTYVGAHFLIKRIERHST